MAPKTSNLFDRARRTHVEWNIEPPCLWEDLAEELWSQENEQVLCIVNLKKHAKKLAELLLKRKASGLFHLSTNMCPAHREAVLDEVRRCLDPKAPQPCRLISTQCVEAGVDVDFPVVYRAFGPLEAIAQAAGRCNRNGNLSQLGKVRVFMPEPEPDEKKLYPPGGYEQAADVTMTLLKDRGTQKMDIYDPVLFEEYYKTLYDMVKNTALPPKLEDALNRRHFVDTAEHYRLIDQDTINVLMPYDLAIFQELKEDLEQDGRLTRAWIKKARPYTISLPRYGEGNYLNPVPLWGGEKSDDWFVYLKPEHYTPLLGLNPPQGPENWMV